MRGREKLRSLYRHGSILQGKENVAQFTFRPCFPQHTLKRETEDSVMDDSPHAGRFRGGKIVVLISAAIHKHQCHETGHQE